VFPCCIVVCVATALHAIYKVGRGGRD
jgi:hypothetical protein